jgi:hypothetical protein
MLDWLTVLELAAVALVVLGVLTVIVHFVNQARTKPGATDGGKTRTVEEPIATPESHAVPPPTITITSPATVVPPPAADDAALSSESLLPPLEPIPPVGNAPLPTVEAVAPVSKTASVRFPRFAKPPAVPVARLKNATRLKPTRSSKTKRRVRGGDTARGRPLSFAPVTKAKPALTRRPKRVTQVRRKRITAPVKRSGKVAVHRSPRLTPA